MSQKYNIYGIGNALVDTEIKVEPEVLTELNLEKGVVTLLENEEQLKKLELHFKDAEQKQASGGSAANTVIGANQMGATCYFSCKVADDQAGQFYLQDFEKNNIPTNLTTNNLPTDGKTGTCLVFITPDADRTMAPYLGISATFAQSEINEDVLKQSDYLYIEGYLVTSETGKAAAIHARKIAEENDIKVAMTLSDPNMAKYFRDGLDEMIGDEGLDILFCNEDEALEYAQTSTLEEALMFLAPVAEQIVVTLGERGAIIQTDEEGFSIDAFDTKVIDTLGAGDCFAGAYLAGLTQGYSIQHAGELANYAASRIVSYFGPRLSDALVKDINAFQEDLTSPQNAFSALKELN